MCELGVEIRRMQQKQQRDKRGDHGHQRVARVCGPRSGLARMRRHFAGLSVRGGGEARSVWRVRRGASGVGDGRAAT